MLVADERLLALTRHIERASLFFPLGIMAEAMTPRLKWTAEEDTNLRQAVAANNGRHWKRVAALFPGRTDVQCLHRWQKVLNPDLVKGPWSAEVSVMSIIEWWRAVYVCLCVCCVCARFFC